MIRQAAGVPSYSDSDEADQRNWEMLKMGVMITKASDSLKLISRAEVKVDGLTGIKRLYEYPLVDPNTYKITATQYNYQVMILKDGDLYNFRLYTTNTDTFKKYTQDADGLISSILFQK